MLRWLLPVVALAVAVAYDLPGAEAQSRGRAGDFDYYVLSISWSPSYCAAAGSRADPRQCDSGRPFAFVVHGLWPQYERGWPQFCRTDGRKRLRGREIDGILDLMPSRGLIRHEWSKHGTCSGLSPQGYFRTVRQAWNKLVIPRRYERLESYLSIDPRSVEKDFLAANPKLRADAIAISCKGRRLTEVLVCMDRNLNFRRCEAVDRRGCRARKVVMPPVRGHR